VERQWKSWLINRICRNREERAFFRFADHMMRNEREFRLKVYPSLGLSLVFPFIFMFNEIQQNSFDHLVGSKWYLAIYFSTLMIPNAVMMLKFSGKYKGAWVFKTTPIQSLAPLKSAALKVFIVNLFLPVYVIVSAVFIGIFGMSVMDDVLVVFVTAIIYTVICSNYLKGTMPFSESFEDAQQSGGVKMILSFFFIGGFAGIHYASTFIPYGVWIYFILLFVAAMVGWRQAYRNAWK
jgi:hypothetical protein